MANAQDDNTGDLTQDDLDAEINSLNIKIQNTTGVEKLKLMDSLTNLVKDKSEYNYDSIAKVTIDLAFKEQDYNMAARKTSELIFFLVYEKRNPEEGLKLFEATLNKNWDITDLHALAVLYSSGAGSYIESGLKKEAIHYYGKAEELFLEAEDTTQYALNKAFKAYVLSTMGEFSSASQEYQKALSVLMEREDDLNILKIRIGLSILYSQNRFYDEAEKEYFAIDSLALKLEDYGAYLANLENMAYDYSLRGEYKKSISCKQRMLTVLDDHPELDFFRSHSLHGLALDYIETDSLVKARLYARKLKELIDSDPKNSYLEIRNTEVMAKLLLAEGDLTKAEANAKELFEIRQGSLDYESMMNTHELLYHIYEAKKDEQKALKHLKSFTKIKDSIESVQKAKALSYYQTLYETEKRDFKIASQQNDIIILDQKNKVKQQWLLFGTIGSVALLLMLYFRYKQRLKYRVLENELLNSEIEYKKKDLANLAINISENQKWAQVLANKIDAMKGSSGRQRAKYLADLENEINNKIWIDEDAKSIQDKIDTLSSAFYEKLNSQFNNLSKTDIKLCALIRMNIDNKQIAILQNISPSSVKMSRYRLRKKLNLSQDQDLNKFLNTF